MLNLYALDRFASETIPVIRSKLVDPLYKEGPWSHSGRWNGTGQNMSGNSIAWIRWTVGVRQGCFFKYLFGRQLNPEQVLCNSDLNAIVMHGHSSVDAVGFAYNTLSWCWKFIKQWYQHSIWFSPRFTKINDAFFSI